MTAHHLFTRSLAIILLIMLSGTWFGPGAWAGITQEVEWKTSDEGSSNETKEDAKHLMRAFSAGQRTLLLPGSLLLSLMNSQDGQLPTEHISEVPVPPPLR